MEISQLRSGWCWLNKIIRPGGTMENVRRISMSLQDTISFYDKPDTMCLANFRLSLWDETIPARSFSTVHGRSRTTKPRPARQSGSLSGNAQTSRRRLAMTRQAVGEISMPIMARIFNGTADDFPFPCWPFRAFLPPVVEM